MTPQKAAKFDRLHDQIKAKYSLKINNPKGNNRFTPKEELKGKPISKYNLMTETELKDYVFKTRRLAKEFLNKGAGLMGLASKMENRVMGESRSDYTDEELFGMVVDKYKGVN